MGRKVYAVMALVAVAMLGGCTKENLLPPTELPKKPLSSTIPCVPLTDLEKMACLKEAQEARNVCKKVEMNHLICEDQRDFVKRLYEARDGK